MKFRGKAISGTSLLTILGVLCFATVIVSAVMITSNTLSFPTTTVSSPGSIALTKTTSPDTIVLGNDAAYEFNADAGNALTGAVATVDIEKSGIVPSDIGSATFQFNGVSVVGITFSAGAANHITASYTIGGVSVDPTLPCIVTIHYAVAGTYTVSVTIAGNA